VIACVAPASVPTEAARKALPGEVPFSAAAATAGRAALLATLLAHGEAAHLLAATDDVLHQPARFALMPDSGKLVGALRAAGIAAFLAGAGPSVAALVSTADAAAAEETVRRAAPESWEVRLLDFDPKGAEVVETA
jgi:homoserine kinase